MALPSRRRLAAFAVLVLVAAGACGVAILIAGGSRGDRAARVPEGGSAFGLTAAAAPRDGTRSGRAASGGAPGARVVPGGGGPDGLPSGPVSSGRRTARPPAGQAQRLAQLFLVGFRGSSPADPFFARLASRRWGAVIVDASNDAGEAALGALTAQLGQTLRDVGAPAPLIVADQGGGADSTLPGLPPSPQRTIGSRAEARADATRASRKLRRLGIRMTLAPSADLGYSGAAWDGRAFGDDPGSVDRRVAGAVAGWRTGGVAPAVGHFPGEGAASQDPADGPASVGLSLDELQAADLRAFAGALSTAPALLLSNALYAAFDGVTPATLLAGVTARARRAGFRGTIVSGNLAETVLATGGTIADAAVAALRAGCDLLWIPGDAADQEAAYRAVVRAVRRGDVPQARVRSALGHVAALKRKFVGPAGG